MASRREIDNGKAAVSERDSILAPDAFIIGTAMSDCSQASEEFGARDNEALSLNDPNDAAHSLVTPAGANINAAANAISGH